MNTLFEEFGANTVLVSFRSYYNQESQLIVILVLHVSNPNPSCLNGAELLQRRLRAFRRKTSTGQRLYG